MVYRTHHDGLRQCGRGLCIWRSQLLRRAVGHRDRLGRNHLLRQLRRALQRRQHRTRRMPRAVLSRRMRGSYVRQVMYHGEESNPPRVPPGHLERMSPRERVMSRTCPRKHAPRIGHVSNRPRMTIPRHGTNGEDYCVAWGELTRDTRILWRNRVFVPARPLGPQNCPIRLCTRIVPL